MRTRSAPNRTGDLLRKWREIEGLSQGALAKRLQHAQGAISDIERCLKVPGAPLRLRIAKLIPSITPEMWTLAPIERRDGNLRKPAYGQKTMLAQVTVTTQIGAHLVPTLAQAVAEALVTQRALLTRWIEAAITAWARERGVGTPEAILVADRRGRPALEPMPVAALMGGGEYDFDDEGFLTVGGQRMPGTQLTPEMMASQRRYKEARAAEAAAAEAEATARATAKAARAAELLAARKQADRAEPALALFDDEGWGTEG